MPRKNQKKALARQRDGTNQAAVDQLPPSEHPDLGDVNVFIADAVEGPANEAFLVGTHKDLPMEADSEETAQSTSEAGLHSCRPQSDRSAASFPKFHPLGRSSSAPNISLALISEGNMDDSVDDSTLHSGHYSDTEYYQRNVVNLVFGPNFPQAYNHWFKGQRYKSLFDVWDAKIADGQNACNTEASEDEFFQTVLRRNQRDLDKLNPAKNFRRTPEYAAAGAERKLKSQQAKTALFQHQFITLRQKKLTKRAPKKRPPPKPSGKTPAPKRPLHSGTPASPMSITSSSSSSPTPSLSEQPSTSSKPDVPAEPRLPYHLLRKRRTLRRKSLKQKRP